MKAIFYNVSRLFKFLPLNLFIELTGQKLIFPFYHLVSDADTIHVKHLYRVRTVKEFERDLDFYLREYNPLDVRELIRSIHSGHKIKKKGFLLSFDDGLREFSDIVAPVLVKKGIPAVCFLNSGFIDNKDLFFRYKASILIEMIKSQGISDSLKTKIKTWAIDKNVQFDKAGKFLLNIGYLNRSYIDELAGILGVNFNEYLITHKPYLTSVQITSLQKQGFSFGAHSIDHPQYSELQLQQQLYQTTYSINEITAGFDLDYKVFSFPFTDYNLSGQFFDAIFNENPICADLTFGCAGIKRDECRKNLQRTPIETGSYSAKEIIFGEYVYYLFKTLINKNVIRR